MSRNSKKPVRASLNERRVANQSLDALIGNVAMIRSDFIRQMLDPRRDIEQECGFPPLQGYILPEFYWRLYDRDSYAARVVEVLPMESWKTQPKVYESDTPGETTPFEQDLANLARSLSDEDSYHAEDKDSKIWEALLRLDILSRVGQYGVILFGFDDENSGDLTLPVIPKEGMKLNYLRVLPEALAKVSALCIDRTSKRFGMPEKYMINFVDPSDNGGAIQGNSLISLNVHHSRLLHVAGSLRSSEWLGVQALRPVLNNILSLRKSVHGSGEMFWKGALPGISLETVPQLGADVKVNKEDLRNQMEQFMNGLQRYLALTGMGAKTLAPQLVDPTPFIEVQIVAICIKLGIPMRVFKGSERGELASTQDDDNHNDRMKHRQKYFITPRIICPFIDRLINVGVLRKPTKGYKVSWPDLSAMSALDRANIAMIKTNVLATYASSPLTDLIGPTEFLTKIFGMSLPEANALMDKMVSEAEKDFDLSTPSASKDTREKRTPSDIAEMLQGILEE